MNYFQYNGGENENEAFLLFLHYFKWRAGRNGNFIRAYFFKSFHESNVEKVKLLRAQEIATGVAWIRARAAERKLVNWEVHVEVDREILGNALSKVRICPGGVLRRAEKMRAKFLP